MIETLLRGVLLLRAHSRLWIVVAFVVLLPLAFTIFYQSENEVVAANLATVLQKKISTTHDALEVLIQADFDFASVSEMILSKHEEITDFQIVTEEAGVLVVLFAQNREIIGTEVPNSEPFRSTLIHPGSTYIYQYRVGDRYEEHAFRVILSETQSPLYVFTVHDFTPLYYLFAARADRLLPLLFGLFLLLIMVAYWLARQINYESLYDEVKVTLQERDTFMTSLVHELRAPLTAMRGYASMIEEASVVPATERDYAVKIRQSTSRLIVLVNDFLEAARIQSGQLPLVFAPCHVNNLLERVESAALPTATEKGLVLALRLPSEPMTLITDEKRLEQVLTNVLSNAIKYTPRGSVTLSAKQDFRYTVFTIADTGAGISAEDQRKLFSPFVRVGDTAQREQVTGTGLGMWITRQLVIQLGGVIEVESIKDVGTHVIIKLPLKRSS